MHKGFDTLFLKDKGRKKIGRSILKEEGEHRCTDAKMEEGKNKNIVADNEFVTASHKRFVLCSCGGKSYI